MRLQDKQKGSARILQCGAQATMHARKMGGRGRKGAAAGRRRRTTHHATECCQPGDGVHTRATACSRCASATQYKRFSAPWTTQFRSTSCLSRVLSHRGNLVSAQ